MRFLLIFILAFLIGAAVLVNAAHVERKLLRADPDTVPADPALRRFVVSRGEPAFVAHSALCHGVSGAGDPLKGVPNLTDNDWLYGTQRVADIAQITEYGNLSHNSRAWRLA